MEQAKQRVGWVDYAKGICIILVVAMHSTLGVEKAAGSLSSLHGFIDWARPFRMPDFFLISGLFLASRIDRPWRTYLDTKFIHFAYFYLLWMTIQFLTKGYGIYQDGGVPALANQYALGFMEPYRHAVVHLHAGCVLCGGETGKTHSTTVDLCLCCRTRNRHQDGRD